MNNIDLENRDILQINAVLITGALIFLTLFGTSTNLRNITTLPFVIVIALTVIIFFSFSSLLTIIGNKKGGIDFMKWGFVLILIFAFVILLGKYIRGVTNSISEFFDDGINQTNTNQTAINQTVNQFTNLSLT